MGVAHGLSLVEPRIVQIQFFCVTEMWSYVGSLLLVDEISSYHLVCDMKRLIIIILLVEGSSPWYLILRICTSTVVFTSLMNDLIFKELHT